MGCSTHIASSAGPSLTGPVLINVPRSACLVSKMVLILKRFHMCPNFPEMPLTCGIMVVPWNIVSEEGQLLIDGFVME
jgi:hypothetical protein